MSKNTVKSISTYLTNVCYFRSPVEMQGLKVYNKKGRRELKDVTELN